MVDDMNIYIKIIDSCEWVPQSTLTTGFPFRSLCGYVCRQANGNHHGYFAIPFIVIHPINRFVSAERWPIRTDRYLPCVRLYQYCYYTVTHAAG